ncbi:MAG: DUF695 domain-containing protein, partial [Dysgonamonadaceae bacterium]|nr:DUF695 domain-containing protein [Dysgonamonadaceae bacterium]
MLTIETNLNKKYSEFWNWFEKNENKFYKIVEGNKMEKIEEEFFNPLSGKLSEIRNGYFYLTGMIDENTAELIISAEGNINNFVFVEELVKAAPDLPNWKFTALKPEMPMDGFAIDMNSYRFEKNNLYFYSNDDENYPDEITLTLVHDDLTEANKGDISHGIYVFLDNFLGEFYFATTIDNIHFIEKSKAEKQLIPIEKLKSFLIWREKEFLQKYDTVSYDTGNDAYATMSATLKSGLPLIAIVNTSLLDWPEKPSHSWILSIEIGYDGSENNGLPNKKDYELLNEIEDEIMSYLIDTEGYLNVARETAENIRTHYFACKVFRKSTKIKSS